MPGADEGHTVRGGQTKPNRPPLTGWLPPHYTITGPASAFPVWVGKLVEACGNKSVPLDFVSSHGYPTTGGARDAEMKGLVKQVKYSVVTPYSTLHIALD